MSRRGGGDLLAQRAAIARAKKAQEEAKARKKFEEEQKRLEEERIRQEEEQKRLEQEAKEAERQRKREEIARLKKEGKYKTPKQLEEERQNKLRAEKLRQQFGIREPRERESAGADQAGRQHDKSGDKHHERSTTKTIEERRAERARQEADRINQLKQQMNKIVSSRVDSENPALQENITTCTAALEAEQEELKTCRAELEKAQNDLKDAEDEEIVDDWELDADDDADDNSVDAIKSRISTLEQRIAVLEESVKANQDALKTHKAAYREACKAMEIVVKKEEEERKKKEEDDARIALELEANKHLGNANLRAPVVVVLGHVDSGKTSLMDALRGSNVTKGEAGGITQQIGASFLPADTIRELCAKSDATIPAIDRANIPGFVGIDTPGHESFSMLRERGNDICDAAILIVDIQQGIQQQTIESIQLLQKRGTPFIVAVTKVDAIYGWKKGPEFQNNPILKSLEANSEQVRGEFEHLYQKAFLQFAENEINVKLFYENDDPETFASVVPVSSKTGEGIPDLLEHLIELTAVRMAARLSRQQANNQFECTILEVNHLEGYGTTLDVVLVNGSIREGDRIICGGLDGPVETVARTLLLPPHNRDQRVQRDFRVSKVVHAAMGFKIAAPDISRVIAGSRLFVIRNDDELEDLRDEVQADLSSVVSELDKDNVGVFVHASSLGSLESLLVFLRDNKVPVSGFDIGTVYKSSIARAATQLDKVKPEYAIILAFDVRVDPAAQKEADQQGVKIFCRDVIYHLHEQCLAHFNAIRESNRLSRKPVFPVALRFVNHPNGKPMIFHHTDPILIGIKVVRGKLRKGTPLIVYHPGKPLNGVNLGTVQTIKLLSKEVNEANEDQEVSILIAPPTGHGNKPELTDKNCDGNPQFLSRMTDHDIEFIMDNFRDELTENDLKLIETFKKLRLV